MTLVLLGEGEQAARIVPRVREGEARREDGLRDLLFAQPAMLPVAEIILRSDRWCRSRVSSTFPTWAGLMRSSPMAGATW